MAKTSAVRTSFTEKRFAGKCSPPRNDDHMRVVVVGAGPAGSSAAIELARAGAAVRLIEKSTWPRAKTCGDGISPDGVRVARGLGVDLTDRVPLAFGTMSSPSRVVFRGGWPAELPWGAIVERRDFDDRLAQAAVAAGAQFEPGTTVRAIEPLAAGGARIVIRRSGSVADAVIEADAVVLAEGATGSLALAAGFGKHRSRLVALRGYVRSDRDLEPSFGLHFDRAVVPGYAWIFPLDARFANVGILVDDGFSRRDPDLRGVLERWLRESPFARESLGDHPIVERVSGGVIPTGRPQRVRGAIFAVGDAAGVADPFSAEGIAQAMSCGVSVAGALIDARGDLKLAARTYARSLATFDANARASRRMRTVFRYVVDPLSQRAAIRPALAQHLSSEGFFRKESVASFLIGIARTW